MITSRSLALSQLNPIRVLNDDELRLAIAKEIFNWCNVQIDADGRITGENPTIHTIVPKVAPDWINNEISTGRVEFVIERRGWILAYRRELAKIAGDFNPATSGRQRCEAALATARLSDWDRQ
jgi:hypothetical protein